MPRSCNTAFRQIYWAAPTFCMPFTSSSSGRSCLAGALREPCSGRQDAGSRSSSCSELCAAASPPRLRLRVVLVVLFVCTVLSASLRLAVMSANGLAGGSPAWKASALAAAAASASCWGKSPSASAAAVDCGLAQRANPPGCCYLSSWYQRRLLR